MDNFTHSLAGWALSQAGLKRKTGLATATLVIAANLPDIDAVAVLLGGHQHLAIRRGLTHGPIAMALLPIALTAFMLWLDRWQTRRGKRPASRPPVNMRWLFALAVIGTLSHPALDWMNSYGVRLLEPFSSQWFYGDTLFIIDVWLWLLLPLGIWYSRRLEKAGSLRWRTPALTVVALSLVYIQVNALISRQAVATTSEMVTLQDGGNAPEQVVANPVPVEFWRREMLWRQGGSYGFGDYVPVRGPALKSAVESEYRDSIAAKNAAQQNLDFKAFLFWSRMPIFSFERDGAGMINAVIIEDARFNGPLAKQRFRVRAEIDPVNEYEGYDTRSAGETPC